MAGDPYDWLPAPLTTIPKGDLLGSVINSPLRLFGDMVTAYKVFVVFDLLCSQLTMKGRGGWHLLIIIRSRIFKVTRLRRTEEDSRWVIWMGRLF